MKVRHKKKPFRFGDWIVRVQDVGGMAAPSYFVNGNASSSCSLSA